MCKQYFCLIAIFLLLAVSTMSIAEMPYSAQTANGGSGGYNQWDVQGYGQTYGTPSTSQNVALPNANTVYGNQMSGAEAQTAGSPYGTQTGQSYGNTMDGTPYGATSYGQMDAAGTQSVQLPYGSAQYGQTNGTGTQSVQSPYGTIPYGQTNGTGTQNVQNPYGTTSYGQVNGTGTQSVQNPYGTAPYGQVNGTGTQSVQNSYGTNPYGQMNGTGMQSAQTPYGTNPYGQANGAGTNPYDATASDQMYGTSMSGTQDVQNPYGSAQQSQMYAAPGAAQTNYGQSYAGQSVQNPAENPTDGTSQRNQLSAEDTAWLSQVYGVPEDTVPSLSNVYSTSTENSAYLPNTGRQDAGTAQAQTGNGAGMPAALLPTGGTSNGTGMNAGQMNGLNTTSNQQSGAGMMPQSGSYLDGTVLNVGNEITIALSDRSTITVSPAICRSVSGGAVAAGAACRVFFERVRLDVNTYTDRFTQVLVYPQQNNMGGTGSAQGNSASGTTSPSAQSGNNAVPGFIIDANGNVVETTGTGLVGNQQTDND